MSRKKAITFATLRNRPYTASAAAELITELENGTSPVGLSPCWKPSGSDQRLDVAWRMPFRTLKPAMDRKTLHTGADA